MDIAKVLKLADELLFTHTGEHLDSLEETILKGTLQGDKYAKIASDTHVSEGHVRDKASKLWQALSDILGEDVNKSKARNILQKTIISHSVSSENFINVHQVTICSERRRNTKSSPLSQPTKKTSLDIDTAPEITAFYGRRDELNTLKTWLIQDRLRLVTLVGAIGIGKTTLANFLESANQLSSLMLSNLERAAALIGNFKLVAVDISSEMERAFNLIDYVESTITSLHPAIKNTNTTISVIGDRAINIYTCPGTISQIITNLIMNSLIHAFTDDMAGKITIEIVIEGNQVVVRYTDNGVGMPDEIRRVIFEPFFTTKRAAGGSGLGLSIIYNLVNQNLDGSISCQSEVGLGTTFTIYLPLALTIQNK